MTDQEPQKVSWIENVLTYIILAFIVISPGATITYYQVKHWMDERTSVAATVVVPTTSPISQKH